MNSVDFCFWLQGFFEISGENHLSSRQVEVIKDHLNLVFVHEIDPMREAETTASKDQLNAAHSGLPMIVDKPELTSGWKPRPKPYEGGFGNDPKMRC